MTYWDAYYRLPDGRDSRIPGWVSFWVKEGHNMPWRSAGAYREIALDPHHQNYWTTAAFVSACLGL